MVEGCDGTDRHTMFWAQARGISDEVLRFLDQHACPCDCSVLADLDLDALFKEDVLVH